MFSVQVPEGFINTPACVKKPTISFVKMDNPRPEQKWGCVMAGEGSSQEMGKVQAFCTEKDECTGYYCDKGANWCIATDMDPAGCTDPARNGSDVYHHFYKKTETVHG